MKDDDLSSARKALFEGLVRSIEREMSEAESYKKSSYSSKNMYFICRLIEIALVIVLVVNFLFYSGVVSNVVIVTIICWLLINPSSYFHRVSIEAISNANVHLMNGDFLNSKKEMVVELDSLEKKIKFLESGL